MFVDCCCLGQKKSQTATMRQKQHSRMLHIQVSAAVAAVVAAAVAAVAVAAAVAAIYIYI